MFSYKLLLVLCIVFTSSVVTGESNLRSLKTVPTRTPTRAPTPVPTPVLTPAPTVSLPVSTRVKNTCGSSSIISNLKAHTGGMDGTSSGFNFVSLQKPTATECCQACELQKCSIWSHIGNSCTLWFYSSTGRNVDNLCPTGDVMIWYLTEPGYQSQFGLGTCSVRTLVAPPGFF